MNFTANPLEREMKRRPRPQAPRPEQPPRGSRCSGCPYWRGIPCGSCYQALLSRPGGGR